MFKHTLTIILGVQIQITTEPIRQKHAPLYLWKNFLFLFIKNNYNWPNPPISDLTQSGSSQQQNLHVHILQKEKNPKKTNPNPDMSYSV